MSDRDDLTLGLGPVGLAGAALLMVGIVFGRRVLALVGLAGIVADVTRPELGGFRALNEPASAGPSAPAVDEPYVS